MYTLAGEFLREQQLAVADRMSVVLNSIEFFIRKTRSSKMYKDVHFGVIASVPLLKLVFFKRLTERLGAKVMTTFSRMRA